MRPARGPGGARCASLLCLVATLAAGCATTTGELASSAPGTAAARVELLETYWRLAAVDGEPVVVQQGTREPHIILRREGTRVTGYTGCNSLAGGFKQDDDALRFGPLAMTRMACLSASANATEAAFTKALEDAVAYRIAGETLELRDKAGTVRTRFEARQPR